MPAVRSISCERETGHDHRTLGIQMISRGELELLSALSIPAKHDSLQCAVTFGWWKCGDFLKMSPEGWEWRQCGE